MRRGLRGMAMPAQQLDICCIKQRAAISKFDDVVAEDPDRRAVLVPLPSTPLALAPALSNDPRDESAPFGAQIYGVGLLLWRTDALRRAWDARLEDGQGSVTAVRHRLPRKARLDGLL